MIHHIYREFEPRNEAELTRNAFAQSTWGSNRIPIPVRDENLYGFYDENGSKLPFVKDVLDYGTMECDDDSMCMFTVSDVGFSTHAIQKVTESLDEVDAGDAFRHAFPDSLTVPPSDSEIINAEVNGKNIWFFKAKWWRKHRNKMPDMLLTRAAWDFAFQTIIEETTPKYIELRGIAWHLHHPWMYHGTDMHGNKHNLNLIRKFLHERNMSNLEYVMEPAFFGLDWSTPYKP